MDWAQQKRRGVIFYWWLLGVWLHGGRRIYARDLKALSRQDQALYMAAVRAGSRGSWGGLIGGMELVRLLIGYGANPAAGHWAPLTMAAAIGDLPAVEWLIGLSRPSGYAVSNSIVWATERGHAAVVKRLQQFAAEGC